MKNNKLSFRQKCNTFFGSNEFSIPFILIISVLMMMMENVGQIIGFIGILLILWASRWNWGNFGWFKALNLRTIAKALFYMLLIIIIVDVLLTPFIISISNTPINLENFDSLKGNLASLLISMILMWIIAAIGEELLYRGFIMKKIAEIFGNTNKTWIIAAFLSSTIFGIAHMYQGLTGMITAGIVALILAIAFFYNKKNLLVCILAHGFYDMFGLSMIYLDKENIINDFMQQYVFAL